MRILEDIIKEIDLQVRTNLVSLEANKAEVVTRVKKSWMKIPLDAVKKYAMLKKGASKNCMRCTTWVLRGCYIWPGR